MADDKPTSVFYKNLGGVNLKASEYSLDKAQFLNIRNMDFDVPNALSKRVGSTQAIGENTSGPVTSLMEFVRLDGASVVIAGTDTAMFYKSGLSLTLLDAGWSNGQPTDMLTFVNRAWMANGAKFIGWSGIGATPILNGLPCAGPLASSGRDGGGSNMLVGGATMAYLAANSSYVLRGIYAAISYVRNDGYNGPANFLTTARNLVTPSFPGTSGDEYFSGIVFTGFSAPPNRGISAISVWVATDTITAGSGYEFIKGVGATAQVGNMGWIVGTGGLLYESITLKPTADLSRFWLYTTIAAGAFTDGSMTLTPRFNTYTGIANGQAAFTGMDFCWFDTNTPKYLEVNQNSMFFSGFSQNPSTVWFSELGTPEQIEPESSMEVRTNDGDRIYATKAFNSSLIVFKQNSFHKVIGDSPENFQLIELSLEYGCISNQTVVEYEEKLMWLDQKGIVEYNGASWNIKSTPVEDIFRRMNLGAAKEKACGVHHLYRNQIWWGIPIDSSTKNNITVVYDYLVDAWTFFDGYNPSSYSFIQSDLSRPTVWRGDYSGMIYYHDASFLGDNGQGITCLLMPHWDKNKENETWIWRRAFLDVATASGLTGEIRGNVFKDYDQSTVQATFSTYQNQFQTRVEMGVPGKAVTAEFSHFSASLPLLINGYSWAKRFLRNV